MSILYFILVTIILIILLVLVVPLKIKVNLNIKTNNENSKETLKMENKIEIYILRFIKIKTIDLKQKDKTNIKNKEKESTKVVDDVSKLADNVITYEKRKYLVINKKDLKKLMRSITFNEFYLIFGFNFKEPIINAYVIAIINSLINIYLAQNLDKFKIEDTAYKTYISNKIIDFNFFSIINFKLVNNIIIIFKIIIKLRKVVNKNG